VEFRFSEKIMLKDEDTDVASVVRMNGTTALVRPGAAR
jgi:hypothetical protein